MAAPESGTIAVLAEKPSVARDIARVLGATGRGDGYLHGNGYVVTWAVGHLAALAQPHEINPEWRHWRRDVLPILPKRWPLIVYEKTKDQFRDRAQNPRLATGFPRRLCDRRRPRRRVDFPLYLRSGAVCQISQSTVDLFAHPRCLRKGFDTLRPSSDYDALADAARESVSTS